MKIAMEKMVAGGIAAAIAALTITAVLSLDRPVMAAPAGHVALPAPQGPAVLAQPNVQRAQVVFAGGCFWGVQGVFQHMKGVETAVSGYIGGSAGDARYERVGTGQTGHAEAVQVTYDPAQVSYAQLMQVFFSVVHDPTQLNRQGPDHGTQYRSAIYPLTPEQTEAAKASLARFQAAMNDAHDTRHITTEIATAKPFYYAEDDHQQYLHKNPYGYCGIGGIGVCLPPQG